MSEEGSVVVLSKDGEKHVFSGLIADDLAEFVAAKAFPQSMDLNPEMFQQLLAGSVVVVTAYDYKASDAETFRDAATETAKAHNLKQMFADSNQWGPALVRMGVISGNVYPTAVAFDGRGEASAPIAWDEDVELNAEGFNAWMAGVIAGTQETWKKSEAIPESNDGPVTVVVGKQFEEIALDNTKDVLVEFYAPWCGHCKNLAPIYEAVGEHFQNDKNVIIAKMDATANYVNPALGIQGFPTLKFFPSESNDVVDYEGDRTLEDIVEFVSSNRNSQV
jgi:protein disulfide-isomerase A1